MNTKPYIFGLVAFSLFAIPASIAHAATFLTPSGDVASVRSEVAGDLYTASQSVVIASPVKGDIFAAGDTLDISGSSDASIFAAGNNLSITGAAQDDVRVAGNRITIGSAIAHDLFAAGSVLFISPESTVGGEAYVAGEQITISGKINGDVRAAGERVLVTKDASISGKLTVYGNEPTIEEGATIAGGISTVAKSQYEKNERSTASRMQGFIASVATHFVLAMFFIIGTPALLKRGQHTFVTTPTKSGIIGLVWIILFIPVSVILLITQIGSFLGLFLLFGSALSLMIACSVSIITIGMFIHSKVTKKTEDTPTWQHALIGSLILSCLFLLGFLGFLIASVLFLIALGATGKTLSDLARGI